MRYALLTLASARLSRLVTTDQLGEWFIHNPVYKWADKHEHVRRRVMRQDMDSPEPVTWQGRLASGLECPFCVGFWATLGVVAVERATRSTPRPFRAAVEVVGTALAVNYVVGHAEARLTETEDS